MTECWLMLASFFFGLLTTSASISPQNPTEKPNVILIIADDLGYSDLEFMGSDFHQTPHLNQFAKEGRTFTRAYAQPNCAPTRASLMTGKHTVTHGVYTVGSGARGKEEDRKLIPANNKTEISQKTVTLGDHFKSNGYKTAFIGKWHLGEGETGAEKQGFDFVKAAGKNGHPKSYYPPFELPHLEEKEGDKHLTERLSSEASLFIKNQNGSQPFFLTLSYYAVHTPIQPDKDLAKIWSEKTPGTNHKNKRYAALVDGLDKGVGVVLETLKVTGLDKTTMVIFISDNGGYGGYESTGIRNAGPTNNVPLKGGKGQLYEGGVKIPMIVRYPNVIKAGSKSNTLIHVTDFLPTLHCYLGFDELPDEIDGIDLSQSLTDDGIQRSEPLIWHFPGYLEQGQGQFRTTPASAIIDGDYKLIYWYEDKRTELYNIVNDPNEKNDLSKGSPAKVMKLKLKMDEWLKSSGATFPQPKEKLSTTLFSLE